MTHGIRSKADEARRERGPIARLWDHVSGYVVVAAAVLAINSLGVGRYYIPSISMMPNLLVGDSLIVSKYPYGYSYASVPFHLLPVGGGRIFGSLPKRGDIVVFEHPVDRIDYIKRVVALPGDRIAMRGGRLILNGVPVKREVQPSLSLPVDPNNPCSPYDLPGALTVRAEGGSTCELPIVRETLPDGTWWDTVDLEESPQDDYPELLVPPGHVFMMGDNRDRSADSRIGAPLGLDGPIPIEAISGRAEFLTFSHDGSFRLADPSTWLSSFREGRAGLSLRPRTDKVVQQ